MTPAVEDAIRGLKTAFPKRVDVTPLADGGAKVVVRGMELGAPYAQSDTWFGFTLTYLHPYADIYPHFVRADLSRLDSAPLGEAIHLNNTFYNETAVMVSRRTRLFGPENPVDAQLKLLKVQKWMLSR